MDETFTIAEIVTNSIGESLKKRCSNSSLATWLRKVEIVVPSARGGLSPPLDSYACLIQV